MTRLLRLLPAFAVLTLAPRLVAAPASPLPMARVISNPGAEYADIARSWQGIPGVERAPGGRLWVTWYSGDVGEGAMGNYAMVATSGDDGSRGQSQWW